MKQFICLLLLLLPTFLLAQTEEPQRKVKIERANTLEGRASLGPDIRILTGEVVFSHDGALLYCDSAYHNSTQNTVEAYGRIHIAQGDTIHLYGDLMVYSGNDKTARLEGNVELHNDSLTLKSEDLVYYIDKQLARYSTGGVTVTKGDTLRSIYGDYFMDIDMFQFLHSVEVSTADARLTTNQLKHYTQTRMSDFSGETNIYGDSVHMKCIFGTWDHKTQQARIVRGKPMIQMKAQTIKGDSLFFDQVLGVGEAFRNVVIIDTVQRVTIKGKHARYEKATEMAMVTGVPSFEQADEKGEKLFLHADTLLTYRVVQADTLAHKIVKAYHNVRSFRSNFQNVCDSMVYSFADSTIELHRGPIIWAEDNQITADFVKLYTKDGNPHMAYFEGKAFVVSPEDSGYYNQLKGADMTAYFEDGELRRVDVQSKGEVIYMVKDKNVLSGMNRAQSERISFFMNNKELDGVLFPTKSKGKITPIAQIEGEEKLLPTFAWHDEIRPKSQKDIFRKIEEVKKSTKKVAPKKNDKTKQKTGGKK